MSSRASSTTAIRSPITLLPPSVKPGSRQRKPHWNDDKGKGFNNPWASFRDMVIDSSLLTIHDASNLTFADLRLSDSGLRE